MIEPKKDIKRLMESKEFKAWRDSHKDSYLSDFFCILDDDSSKDNTWQIDFYNPSDDTLTSFELPVDMRKKCRLKESESKIFKHEKENVDKLDISKVKLTDKEAISSAKKKLNDNHKGETPTKTILVLQHNKEHKMAIWNITMMTSSLNLFNAKLDASSGILLDYSLKSAMSLKKEIFSGKA